MALSLIAGSIIMFKFSFATPLPNIQAAALQYGACYKPLHFSLSCLRVVLQFINNGAHYMHAGMLFKGCCASHCLHFLD